MQVLKIDLTLNIPSEWVQTFDEFVRAQPSPRFVAGKLIKYLNQNNLFYIALIYVYFFLKESNV